MKRLTLAFLVAAALGPACGGPNEFADAPPTAAEVKIPVPSAAGAGSGAGYSNSALLGATSEYYQITWGISVVVNGATLDILAVLHAIVSTTPTTQTAVSAIWGPYTPGGLDPLTYRVLVTKTAAQHYTFSIDARPKASLSDGDFLALIDGEITRVKTGVGKGTMTLHYDNRRLLLPEVCEQGTIAFAFDNTNPVATNDVTATQFANNNPGNKLCLAETPYDAAYHYAQSADGTGDFRFTVQANMNPPAANKPALETVEMASQWKSTGEGRSDVKISGGDVAAALQAGGFSETAAFATQCWNGAFATIYQTSEPGALDLMPPEGNEDSCAFLAQAL